MVQIVVNTSAVIVAAVLGMVIGAFWYSPAGFGKQWMRLSGITPDPAKMKGMGKRYAIAFVGTLFMAYVLAHIVWFAHATTVGTGMVVGFWMWLGFIVPVLLGTVLWEGKSWALYVLNVMYYLVVMMAMGVVLAAWR